MGKIRRQRQKFHLSNKSKSTENLSQNHAELGFSNLNERLSQSTENIFAGVDISFDDINKSLPKDFDTQSVVSSKSRKELKEDEKHLSKKEKQKLRHERFIKKIEFTQQSIKAAKERQKVKRTAVIGDLRPLSEALPTLESLKKSDVSQGNVKGKKKNKGILKLKQRQKQQFNDAKLFKKILNDSIFKSNPTQAITEFLKEKYS